MFQPQPTPFVSSFFASPFAFQPASASPASAASPAINSSSNQHNNHHIDPNSNSHEPLFPATSASSLPYGLVPQVPFGYYFNPVALGGGCGGSGLATELVGVGSGSGAGAGLGAQGRPSKASTPAAPSTFTNDSVRGLGCTGSILNNSQQFKSNAPVPSRQTQTRSRQQRQPHPQRHPRQRPPSLIKMEDQQDPHGMAAQQAAAQEYSPDLPVSRH